MCQMCEEYEAELRRMGITPERDGDDDHDPGEAKHPARANTSKSDETWEQQPVPSPLR